MSAQHATAARAQDRLSRVHTDPLADALPPLVLDRQRIVHSAAFRRLLQKTQVFIAVDDDHFRTRMTHTLEVAHLARVLAAGLGLDADLAEVIALAHDLGHPPFGHAGEAALAECLRDAGGFEHNQHTLRIVELLEHPYPQFRGLNLTHVVRSALAKHRTRFDQPGAHPLQDGTPPPPEGFVTALADRVSYALHDLQDGLYAGIIDPHRLDELHLWQAAQGVFAPPASDWRTILRPTVDAMLLRILDDIGKCVGATKGQPVLSPALEGELAELDAFLLQNLYRSERLVRADAQGRRIVQALFAAYLENPQRLPPRYTARVEAQGATRVVTDYVAGMTDRYCLQKYNRLTAGDTPPAAG